MFSVVVVRAFFSQPRTGLNCQVVVRLTSQLSLSSTLHSQVKNHTNAITATRPPSRRLPSSTSTSTSPTPRATRAGASSDSEQPETPGLAQQQACCPWLSRRGRDQLRESSAMTCSGAWNFCAMKSGVRP